MRKIYLIRHGQPDFPDGKHLCLGQADVPLGVLGSLQACQLGWSMRDISLELVAYSPLSRAEETAAYIKGRHEMFPDLKEMNAGDWDGLSFDEIKQRWPELYAARGRDPFLPIPNSEEPAHCQKRFESAVREALRQCQGDIAVVAHKTVNQTLVSLAKKTGLDVDLHLAQPYCSYYLLGFDGSFSMLSGAVCPTPPLESALAEQLLEASKLPPATIAHCRAVAEEAKRICRCLEDSGLTIDCDLVYNSALLHDIARAYPEHPRFGASWLEALGYPAAAALVRRHHELGSIALDEAAVLYIADKCVSGSRLVPLSVRFEESRKKCQSPEALAVHSRREREVFELKKMINEYCKKEVII